MAAGFDPNMKILIVDDFATMRQIVRKSLLQLGYHDITEAADGIDALAKLEKGDFNFIISDWNMPNMMGIEFLRRVRANAKHKTTPFLMVTAEAKRENVLEAASAGVSQYIVKPFTLDALQEKMNAIFLRRMKEAAAKEAASKNGV